MKVSLVLVWWLQNQKQEEGPVLARMPVPEHNGFGSEHDSYMNCISLIPKAPHKDFYKFIYKDGKVTHF